MEPGMLGNVRGSDAVMGCITLLLAGASDTTHGVAQGPLFLVYAAEMLELLVIETFAAAENRIARAKIDLLGCCEDLGEGANRDRVDVPNNSSINSQTVLPPVN